MRYNTSNLLKRNRKLMPILKFYCDSHISKKVASQLRDKGVDIIHCEEVGLSKASDIEHLEYAVSENRTIITHDDDFLGHHKDWQAQGKAHHGIMFVHARSQGKVGVLTNEVLLYHELIEAEAGTIEEDIKNQIIFVG